MLSWLGRSSCRAVFREESELHAAKLTASIAPVLDGIRSVNPQKAFGEKDSARGIPSADSTEASARRSDGFLEGGARISGYTGIAERRIRSERDDSFRTQANSGRAVVRIQVTSRATFHHAGWRNHECITRLRDLRRLAPSFGRSNAGAGCRGRECREAGGARRNRSDDSIASLNGVRSRVERCRQHRALPAGRSARNRQEKGNRSP